MISAAGCRHLFSFNYPHYHRYDDSKKLPGNGQFVSLVGSDFLSWVCITLSTKYK
jgi:hypothetical protein